MRSHEKMLQRRSEIRNSTDSCTSQRGTGWAQYDRVERIRDEDAHGEALRQRPDEATALRA